MRLAAFVMLASLTALAAGCGKKSASTGDGSDESRLRGVWAFEKFEAGDPDQAPTSEEMKELRVHFDGDKIRMNGRLMYSFVLDKASNPKVLIVTRVGEDGKPQQEFGGEKGEIERREWLYKFEGENLVLAIVAGPGKRASNFAPRPSSGQPPRIEGMAGKGTRTVKDPKYLPAVDLVTLKKTDEAPPSRPPARPGPRPTLPKTKQ